MQEDGGKKGVNPALEKHWEKIVLGVVVVLAVIFLGSKFSGGGNMAPKSVVAAEADFKRKVDAQNPKIEGPKAIPEPKVPPPAIANRAQEWTIGERTKYSFIVEGPTIELKTYKFPDVSLGSPIPSPDGVKITWSVTKFEKEQNPKKGDPIPVMPPYIYRVERKEKGGDWSVLKEAMTTDKDNFTPDYTDGNTKPKTEYEYRVTVGSNDKTIPKGLSRSPAAPVSVTTPGIWVFDFSQMQTYPDEEPAKPGQVYVTIRKYDREHGLVEWKKIQHEGDLLGVVKEGGVEDSVHRVPDKNGKMVSVDFKSGGKIQKITTGKVVPYTYKACTPKFDKDGGSTCDGPKDVKAEYRVNELKYSDEDGKEQTFTTYDGPGPHADKLCANHGGAPPPKELSAEEKAAQRQTEATKMLDEADTLWASEKHSDKKKAQEIYKKLLISFSDTDAVKPRKSEIADRASKKKIE